MMFKSVLIAGAAALALTAAGSPAAAANAVELQPGAVWGFGAPFERVYGFQFTATQNLSVKRLGVYDDLRNGIAPTPVGVFSLDGTLLASVTVPGNTDAPLEGYFRWANLTSPLLLDAGKSYLIGALNVNSYLSILWNDIAESQYALAPGISVAAGSGRWIGDVTGLTAPLNSEATVRMYHGPNLDFSVAAVGPAPVPEPGTWALMIGGFGLVGGALRARARTAAAA